MAGVDVVEHALTDQVVRDREQLQVMLFEQVAFAAAVGIIGNGAVDLEMITPTGQFESVVTELAGLLAQRLQRQIGPLTGKKGDRSSHGESFWCQFRFWRAAQSGDSGPP